MDNTYSINPNPMPQPPITKEDHRRLLNTLMILVAAAVVIGLLYWWTASINKPASTVSSDADNMRAQVAAILRTAPVHASVQEIESVASQLASSNAMPTESERQAVADLLKGK
jgi:hypothetical protein